MNVSPEAKSALQVLADQLRFYQSQHARAESHEQKQRWATAAADLEKAIADFKANAELAEKDRLLDDLQAHLNHLDRERQVATCPKVQAALDWQRQRVTAAIEQVQQWHLPPADDPADDSASAGIMDRVLKLNSVSKIIRQAEARRKEPVCFHCGRGG